ncbi:MAG: non-canonical purine NTP pyrophosphatase [Myxococcales bacterium]|nr:non-canonical purine NTP pyrophosphatase [Myxococcales bacterium]
MADKPVLWVIASGNPGKQREISQILKAMNLEVEGLARFAPVSFPKEGLDYRENAIAKAMAVASQIGEIAVADDSGIEVDALAGAPGPISARYGGEGLNDRERSAMLLAAVNDVPGAKRTARFVCYAALATPDGDTVVAYGECSGLILDAPRGDGGFGYDPIFQPNGYVQSMAQIDTALKDRISHRALAIRDLYVRWAGSVDS